MTLNLSAHLENNLTKAWKNPVTIGGLMALSPLLPREESKTLDTELLLSHILQRDRAYLYTHWEQALSTKQIKQFQSLFLLRKKGWPMAYILKEKEFYGLKIKVESGVFIPRPDTETLISAVQSYCQPKLVQTNIHIMDFGCGTGCVGLSLLTHFPKADLIGFDINQKAVRLSQINAQNLGLSDRAVFIHQDVSHLGNTKANTFQKLKYPQPDIIVANPPYIAFDDPRVQKEVVQFEPVTALFSAEKGLSHIYTWLQSATQLLKPRGSYFFEIGANQDISSMQNNEGSLQKIAEFKDLSGHVRVIQFMAGGPQTGGPQTGGVDGTRTRDLQRDRPAS